MSHTKVEYDALEDKITDLETTVGEFQNALVVLEGEYENLRNVLANFISSVGNEMSAHRSEMKEHVREAKKHI